MFDPTNPRFKDIDKFYKSNYRVNVAWNYIEEWINDHKDLKLDLDPPFQRSHVWTEIQQRKYLEFKIQEGEGSNTILFNCPGWMSTYEGPLVLVDGKQRLEAVRKFLRNEIAIFPNYQGGPYFFNDFADKLRIQMVDFVVCVNNLPHYTKVLEWYLQINSGGTPHTEDEIDKVRKMLINEKGTIPNSLRND